MAKKSSRSAKLKVPVTNTDRERLAVRAGLNRAVRLEKEIQRLTRQLDNLFFKSETLLVDFARRIVKADEEAVRNARPPAAVNE